MKYKDYEAAVKFEEETEVFYGEVVNTRDVITFQGSSVEELKKAFEDSVEDYLEFCRTRIESLHRKNFDVMNIDYENIKI